MLSADGFCLDCRKWCHEHPGLACPWCGDSKASPEAMGATDPVGAMRDATAAIQHHRQAATRAHQDRRALARHVLADPELVMESLRRGVRVSSLSRWAAPPAGKACARGHSRLESADWDGARWLCRACIAEGPPPPAPANIPLAQRKNAARISAAWRKHEADLAERARLATLDQIPKRLNPPMAPPVR